MPKSIEYNLKPTKDCKGETLNELMDYLSYTFYEETYALTLDDYELRSEKRLEAEKHLKSYIKNLIKQQK